MPTDVLEKITLIIADSSGCLSKKTVDTNILKAAGASSVALNDAHDNITYYERAMDSALKRIDEAIKAPGSTKDPKVLYEIILYLNEINESLGGINHSGELLESAHELDLREFEDSIPPLEFEEKAPPVKMAQPSGEQPPETSEESPFYHPFMEAWESGLSEAEKNEAHRSIMYQVNRARQTLGSIKLLLEQLDEAKSKFDIDNYIKVLKDISVEQQEFESKWQDIYERYIEPVYESSVAEGPPPPPEEPESEEPITGVDVPIEIEYEEPPKTERTPTAFQGEPPPWELTPEEIRERWESYQSKLPLGEEAAKQPAEPTEVHEKQWKEYEEAGMTHKNPETGNIELRIAMMKLQHIKFVDELKKASSMNDPYLLAAMISKYSGMIEEKDPEASLKLIAIAEGIISED